MEEKDKKEFLVLMATLAMAYNEDVAKERAKLYFEFLKGYSIKNVREAIEDHIQASRFFPKISEIIQQMTPQVDHSYWPDASDVLKQIEHREPTRETVSECLTNIFDRIKGTEERESEQREKEFQDCKKILEEQKKMLGMT